MMKKARFSMGRLGVLAFLAACTHGDSSGRSGASTGTSTGTGGSTTGDTVSSAAGSTGAGSTGSTGSSGTTGAAGMGSSGSAGAAGSAGATGTPDKGDAASGASATSGASGTSGASATSGASGTSAGSGMTTDASGMTTGPSATTLIVSPPGSFWQPGTFTTVTSGTPTVVVGTNTAQDWQGMGGFVNELGWKYIQLLSANDQAKVMDALFGAAGARFGFIGIPMSATDYAVARYTDDEVTTGQDLTMAGFSTAEDEKYLIPYVKAAMSVNPNLRFWAAPWTPPTWMKTFSGNSANGTSCAIPSQTSNITPTPHADTSPFDGGCMMTSSAILAAYAQYFVKWIEAYAEQGIAIESVSPQNEANFSENYPSAIWDADLEDKFVADYLGPALEAAGLPTYVMAGLMSNNASNADETTVSTLFGDPIAKSFIKVSGYEWAEEQNVVADLKTYGVPIWQTTHRAGNYPFGNSYFGDRGLGYPIPTDTFAVDGAPNDVGYAVETWELIRRWIDDGVSVYSAWNMVLDTVGIGIDAERSWPQNALITVDTSSNTFALTPAYYVFRHVSQYAQAGAKVLATTSTISIPAAAGTGGDEVLAFQNPDDTITVAMYNPGAAGNFIVSVGGQLIQFMMPAQGWATLVYVPS